MNANKHKMVMNEKNVKAANKEKNDAVIGTQVLKSQIQDLRVDNEKLKNEMNLYKVKSTKAEGERHVVWEQVDKLRITLDRVTKFSGQCEQLFEKMLKIDGLKELLIKEQDKLLGGIAPSAGKDIMKKFKQIQKFQQKVAQKNQDLKKMMVQYRAS